MKKHKHLFIVDNSRGMTLVEIMIAGGIMAGMAVAGMALFKNQTVAQKTVEQSYESMNVMNEIRTILMDGTNCLATMQPSMPPNGGQPTRIVRIVGGNPTYPYQAGQNIPGSITKIVSFRLNDTIPGLVLGSETMLQVNFSRGRAGLRDTVTKNLKLSYTGSPNITGCVAIGAAEELWQLTPALDGSIFYSNGNVGIGTVVPTTRLHVNETSINQFRLQNGTQSLWALQGYRSDGSATPVAEATNVMFQSSGSSAGSFSFTTGNTESLRITSTGNVGIGTASPVGRLHTLGGPAITAGYIRSVTLEADHPTIHFQGHSNTNHSAGIGYDAEAPTEAMRFWVGATSNDFSLTGLEAMTIKVNGNVGIGTSDPLQALHVNGASEVFSTGPGAGFKFRDRGAAVDWNWYANAGAARLARNGTDFLNLNPTGDLGVGVAPAAGAKLDVAGSMRVRGSALFTDAAGAGDSQMGLNGADLGIYHNGVWRMLVTPTGDVRYTNTLWAFGYMYTSDERLKKNIKEIEDPLKKILALRGVNFTWKENSQRDVGFIAQEVEKVEPRLVSQNDKGIKAVKYGNIIAIVVEAIKEISESITKLLLDVEGLKKENQELKARLDDQELRLKRQEAMVEELAKAKR